MKLIGEFRNDNKIEVGDILVYSEYQAFMIIQTDIEYLAVQIMNNGNEELGYINYTDANLDKLIDRLDKDYGLHKARRKMKDVTISF